MRAAEAYAQAYFLRGKYEDAMRQLEQTAARMCHATVETAFARNASSPVSKSNKPTSSPISHINATLSFWKSLMLGSFPAKTAASGGKA